MLAALANPRRLELFLYVADCAVPGGTGEEPCECDCGGVLAEEMGIAPSTVSHHLKELRSAGLVRVTRDGRRVRCWVEPEALRELAEFLGSCAGEADR